MTTYLTEQDALYLVQRYYQPFLVPWTRARKRQYARRLIAKCKKILRTPHLLHEFSAWLREDLATTRVLLQDPMGFWSVRQHWNMSPQARPDSFVSAVIEIDLLCV